MKNRVAPPLAVWGCFLLIAGLLAGLSVWYQFRKQTDFYQEFSKEAALLLHELQTTSGPDVRTVVVMGASNAGMGVADSSFFAERTGSQFRIRKITWPLLNRTAVSEKLDILGSLVRYPPDYLILEQDLLLSQEGEGLWQLRQQLFGWLHPAPGSEGSGAASGGPYPLLTRNMKDLVRPKLIDTTDTETQCQYVRNLSINHYTPSDKLVLALKKVAAEGTRIVIMDVPMPGPVQDAYTGGERGKRMNREIAFLEAITGATYWKDDRRYPFRMYYDGMHLNKEGTRRFSDWLSRKLVNDRPRDSGLYSHVQH